EAPDDLVLIERVRARMGRVVSHPHAIQVGAENGRISLSGPILASEVQSLLHAARSVAGVVEIEDHLIAHPHADSIPSLQGGSLRQEVRQGNWTPVLRIAAVVGGGLLAAYGIRQRGLAGITLASVG